MNFIGNVWNIWYFVVNKKIVSVFILGFFIFSSKTCFGMNEDIKREIRCFWGNKSPWNKSVEDTIQCLKLLLKEEKISSDLSIARYEYKFFSCLYPIVGSYLQNKLILENKKTGDKRLLKSFEDCQDSILIEDYYGKKELISKKDGSIISDK